MMFVPRPELGHDQRLEQLPPSQRAVALAMRRLYPLVMTANELARMPECEGLSVNAVKHACKRLRRRGVIEIPRNVEGAYRPASAEARAAA